MGLHNATREEPQLERRLTDVIERTFWDRWVADRSPLDLLRRIDLDIRIGRWGSRQEAFLDYAGWALRDISAQDHQLRWTVRWLAQCLLDQAEEHERVSRHALAG